MAYEAVSSESIPDEFLEILRRMDEGKDDDPESGIGAEQPPRPRDGPKSSGAVAREPANDHTE